jgi:hypothetical protein
MIQPSTESEPCQLCPICRVRPPYREGLECCGVCLGLEHSQKEENGMPEAVTQYDEVAEASAKLAEKKLRPCSACKRTPNETKFYPSRKDKCADCIAETTKKNRLAIKSVQNPPVVSEDPPEILQESVNTTENKPEPPSSVCNICSEPFDPYKRGNVLVRNLCPGCMNERLRLATGRPSKQAIVLDMKDEDGLFEMLCEAARRERRTPTMQALVILERALMAEAGR